MIIVFLILFIYGIYIYKFDKSVRESNMMNTRYPIEFVWDYHVTKDDREDSKTLIKLCAAYFSLLVCAIWISTIAINIIVKSIFGDSF